MKSLDTGPQSYSPRTNPSLERYHPAFALRNTEMHDMLLSAGEVCEVAGLHPNNLDRWASAWLQGRGVVGRAAGRIGHGRGPGLHRRFTIIETLALYAGARWRAEGADPGRVAGVVYFVARLHLEQLEAAFEEGRTFPVPAIMLGETALPGGGMLIRPVIEEGISPGVRELLRKLDLESCWGEVQQRIEELRCRQPMPPRRGPSRVSL